MARIEPPAVTGMGEHVDWSLHRTEMAVGMGALSEAVYGNSQLPVREREAARWTIALINHCLVCQDTRAKDAEPNHIDEGFYAEVAQWATTDALDRAREARRGVRPALRARPPGHGRSLLGAAAAPPSPMPRSPTSPSAAGCSWVWGVPWPSSGRPRPRSASSSDRHRGDHGSSYRSLRDHDLIIRGGTVIDGTGSPARTADVAISGGTITDVGQVDGTARPRARRRRPHRHPGARRHPRALRRPGHLGQPSHPVVLARRHHRGGRQLRGRLRPGAPGRPRPPHPADGGGGGHPGRGAARGPAVDVAVVPRVPRRARRSSLRRRPRHARTPRRAAAQRHG